MRVSLLLGLCSFQACRHPYAERRIGCMSPVSLSPIPRPSPGRDRVGSSIIRHRVPSGGTDDAAVFALCYGPRGCLPSCPSLTWSVSPAIEDVYIRAFPRPSRLGLKSDMTTRRYRVSTVTGLSPVGTLPLQAAPLPVPAQDVFAHVRGLRPRRAHAHLAITTSAVLPSARH
jgi:hypothetical protein